MDVEKTSTPRSTGASVAHAESAPELVRRRCATEPCPIQLSIASPRGAPVDLRLVGWPMPGPIAVQPASDRLAEVGLACPSPLRVWTVGSQDQAATIAACEVRLGAANDPAWLVGTEAGFEHVKRRFDLFAAAGDGRPIWSVQDGAGPTLSLVIVRRGNKGDEIVRFQVSTPAPGKPDVVERQMVSWKDGSGERDEGATGAGVPALIAVVVGPFASVAAAHQARAKAIGCLDDLWVMRTADLDRAKSGVVLAMPIADAAKAKLAEAALHVCAPAQQIQTFPWPEKRRR